MNNPTTSYDDLLFSVRRSIRYHDYRQQFYTSLGNWTAFLSLILGSGVIAVIAFKLGSNTDFLWIQIFLAFLISLFNGIALVFRVSTKAREHWELRNAFIDLEKELLGADRNEDIAPFTQKRLLLERTEPKPLRVLDLMCHNELCYATYSDNQLKGKIYKIKWHQKMLANFLPYKELKPKLAN